MRTAPLLVIATVLVIATGRSLAVDAGVKIRAIKRLLTRHDIFFSNPATRPQPTRPRGEAEASGAP